MSKTNTSKKTPKRPTSSIKKDVVNPKDWLHFNLLSSCEKCSHFNNENSTCTLGYPTEPHREAEQLRSYEQSGRIAFCRFHEID